ncbi:MAG: phosphonate C-P lyase system protein PhnH [Dehalococcoidia bacterium]|nr:phosphonate C-P lyase system protein PhnH [Dehalococcoidia bacterium]
MTLTLSKKHSFDIVFDSQQVFRLILEAMSNPTRTVSIKEYAGKLYGEQDVFLAVAMTLLDNETSFSTCGSHSLSDEIASLTLAKNGKVGVADFVFVCDPIDIKSVIEEAKCGTLADPHKSAAVIIRNDSEPDCRMNFSGPGIDGHITVGVSGLVKEAITVRDAQCYEYPQGIDLIFISSEGEFFAIPRLIRAEVT